MAIDPVELTQRLIRCPSVTPAEGGALDLLEGVLAGAGFRCRRLPFAEPGTAEVDNLFARFGEGRPHLCFAGHSDVVPPGSEAAWSAPPFAGELRDGVVYGRGAVDMKGAVACFTAAALDFLSTHDASFEGSISLLVTGDEEGPAVNGTARVLEWMARHGAIPDHCLLGEPTNPGHLGEAVKIGRRGSLNVEIAVDGRQGHVAYPELADNPLPRLVAILSALMAAPLDEGSEHFQPSNLEITSIDVGNEAVNVIPARTTARINIRFNEHHTAESLAARLSDVCRKAAGRSGGVELDFRSSGDCFLTRPGRFVDVVTQAVARETGREPALSTGGGTSDARFIKDHCPVVEFGLVGRSMHQVDERVPVEDLRALTRIYRAVLEAYFGPQGNGTHKT